MPTKLPLKKYDDIKTPCFDDAGTLICDHADLPRCRISCEAYAAYDRTRIEAYKKRHLSEGDEYLVLKRKKGKNVGY